MLTVLMIDDDPAVTATVRDHAVQQSGAVDFREAADFGQAIQQLQAVRPDILILDVYHGDPATGKAVGEPIWVQVWQQYFCPVIIYSAGEIDFEVPLPENHPFVRVVTKGVGSEEQVVSHVRDFADHAAFGPVFDDIHRVLHFVLRDTAPVAFQAAADDPTRKDILLRATRRRLAAMMDETLLLTNQRLLGWEQYVFPVITAHPATGDILRAAGAAADSPASYRAVLTPTCDMVPRDGHCKVAQALVAQCVSANVFVTKGLSLQANTKKKTLEKKLDDRVLNEPHQSGLVLLPECPGVFPLMAIDLRQLVLIPLDQIAGVDVQERPFARVASLDSPFRELLAWAFLQVGCRPGVPDRDHAPLVNALIGGWDPKAVEGNP
jgi:hypothetical protein